MKSKSIQTTVEEYYSSKIKKYGTTPKGVDWNSKESQLIRFRELSRIIQKKDFSISDVGCGYGEYYNFLSQEARYKYQYYGYDLSANMIHSSNELYGFNDNAKFKRINNLSCISATNYMVASGIFSVKMEHDDNEWKRYVLETLMELNEKSIDGFAFNMLTTYSDKDCMREDLYYADPLFFFDYCKKNFSKQVALLHDYGLYEFTLLVRKDKK